MKAITIGALLVLAGLSDLVAQGGLLQPVDFQKKIIETPNAQVIDVRTADEFREGHIAKARNMDWRSDSFDKQVASLDKSKPVFVYCLGGPRSSAAAKKMRSSGFKEVYELHGGLNKWSAAKLPLTPR